MDWLRVRHSIYIHALQLHEGLAETQLNTHTEPARSILGCLRISRNRISPPSLDIIFAQVNCSDDQIRVS